MQMSTPVFFAPSASKEFEDETLPLMLMPRRDFGVLGGSWKG